MANIEPSSNTENLQIGEPQNGIKCLKEELAASRSSSGKRKVDTHKDDDDIAKRVTDLDDQPLRDAYRFIRGYTSSTAKLYSTNANTNILNTFNKEVSRIVGNDEQDVMKDLNRLSNDLITGYLNSLRASLNVSGVVAQQFPDAYRSNSSTT
ncbi:hypothetical protein CCP3SC1_520013 [Gammaproteobacteria bacterium]